MLDVFALALTCASTVAPVTMTAIVQVESAGNPYAIGVVDGRLDRQPATLAEALATVEALEAGGWNYSIGLAQINRDNLPRYKLTAEQAFDPCTNLSTGAQILGECYTRAADRMPTETSALHAALSCYYSGDFTRGFRPDTRDRTSYVQRILSKVPRSE